MAWTTISNAAVAVGAIPSSSTVTALRDNPVAVADASSGAPVVFAGWHPVDKVSVGDGKDGLIYDHAVTGDVASVITPDFVDGYEYLIMGQNLSHNDGSSRNLIVDFYKQTSASYTTAESFPGISAGTNVIFVGEIKFPRIASNAHFLSYSYVTSSGGPLGSSDAASTGTVEKVLRARIRFSAGSIDEGKVWLFRRREYASSP
jgi:hypothetical protein